MDWLVPLLAAIGLLGAGVPPPSPPDILLITMDTTRADAVGFSNAVDAQTPVLDELAAVGIRYRTAISPAPLTLPSHATILTGLDPPAHGVRSNGAEALDPALPTLASVFAEAGWSTGAVVGSRVLDHRFGLDHGFATYEDTMIAERIGEYGYPERDARAVTDAAVAWLGDRESKAPIFLWVHYYDPHAPYDPPTSIDGATDRAAYLGEVTYVDGQIGRLLSALPNGLARTTVVVVGDHGEALGDHGESTHGIFLYRAVLEVPLMIVGPTLPKGRSVDEAVTLRQLAPTILQLAGLRDNPIARSVPLPLPDNEPDTIYPIFAEATMSRSAYGWAPLDAVLTGVSSTSLHHDPNSMTSRLIRPRATILLPTGRTMRGGWRLSSTRGQTDSQRLHPRRGPRSMRKPAPRSVAWAMSVKRAVARATTSTPRTEWGY